MNKHAQVASIRQTSFASSTDTANAALAIPAPPTGPEPPKKACVALSLYANYLIDPSSKQTDLQDDVALLFEGVIGTVDVLANGLCEEGSDMAANPRQVASVLWGLLPQLKMIKGIVSALEVRSD
jgi:hypothetical protein